MGRGRKNELILVIVEFLILLNFFLMPFYLVLIFGFECSLLKMLEAKMTSFFLNLVGAKNSVVENKIIIENNVFEVSWDSTGWKSMYLFFSLIMSTPIFLKRKWKILFFGLIFLFIINVLRLFTTIYFSIIFEIDFEFLHIFLWRYFTSFFLLLLWFIFLYTQKYNIGETNLLIRRLYGRGRKLKD
ncbi:MAG: exosortase/archaeosortase family protein [Candidatus Aenigmatarchaeota archaeon]